MCATTDIGTDGGLAFGLTPPSPAPRRPGPSSQSLRTAPTIVASSLSMSGWQASEKRCPTKQYGACPGSRGGKFLPLKGNPVQRSTEAAAIVWATRMRPGQGQCLPGGGGAALMKTHDRGLAPGAIPVLLENLAFWDSEGKRTEARVCLERAARFG